MEARTVCVEGGLLVICQPSAGCEAIPVREIRCLDIKQQDAHWCMTAHWGSQRYELDHKTVCFGSAAEAELVLCNIAAALARGRM